MKQINFIKIIHKRFVIINYLLATIFILSNLLFSRECRDYIYIIYIILMLIIYSLKVIEDRKIDKEKSNHSILKAFLSVFIVIIFLLLFYFYEN